MKNKLGYLEDNQNATSVNINCILSSPYKPYLRI